ncbi:MAG: hypothetical protein AAGA08_11925 [Pseudomonadota bacterium]
MNALPLKNISTPQEVIDDLIADFGFRKVFLAIFARILRGTRPPDAIAVEKLVKNGALDHLPNDLRADIGLPPKQRSDHLHLLDGYSSRHWM